MELGHIFEKLTLAVEAAAMAVIIVGILIATGRYLFRLLRKQGAIESFNGYRRGLGRTLILSLEFLVAADIMRSVLIGESTLKSVGLLGLLVLIRTFLSWSLEMELDGFWPWQKRRSIPGTGNGQENGNND